MSDNFKIDLSVGIMDSEFVNLNGLIKQKINNVDIKLNLDQKNINEISKLISNSFKSIELEPIISESKLNSSVTSINNKLKECELNITPNMKDNSLNKMKADVEKTFKELDPKINIDVDTKNLVKSYDNIRGRIDDIQKQTNTLSRINITETVDGDLSKTVISYTDNLGKAIKETYALKNIVSQVNGESTSNSSFGLINTNYDENIAKINKVSNAVTYLKNNLISVSDNMLNSSLDNIDKSSILGIKKEIQDITIESGNAENKLKTLEKALQDVIKVSSKQGSNFKTTIDSDSSLSEIKQEIASYKELDVAKIKVSQVTSIDKSSGSEIKTATALIKEQSDKWREITISVDKASGEVRKYESQLKSISEIGNSDNAKEFKLEEKIKDVQLQVGDSFSNVSLSGISNIDLTNLKGLNEQINSISSTSNTAETDINDLKRAFDGLLNNIKKQGTLDENALGINFKGTNDDIKQVVAELNNVDASMVRLKSGTITLNEQSQSIKTINASISDGNGGWNKLQYNVNEVTGEVRTLNQGLDEFATSSSRSASQVIKDFLGIGSAMAVIQTGIRTVKVMTSSMMETSNAMSDIQMVTGESNRDTIELKHSYQELSAEISSNTKNVLESADAWLRQGLSIDETNEAIKTTQVFSKIGKIGAKDATDLLTSSMKGYGLDVEDLINIVDKLSQVDIEASTSTQELAVAMSRTAKSAQLAGITMDSLIGYIATISEVTRDSAETIGNSIKSIIARMQKVKLGSIYDDEGEDISKVETVLAQHNIKLRDSQNTFRDLQDVLKEVAFKWKDLTNVERAEIAEQIAGNHQREKFLVLMENFDRALQLSEVSLNSNGMAMQKFEIYSESSGAHLERFFNQLSILADRLIDSTFVNGLLSLGEGILKFANTDIGIITIQLGIFLGLIKSISKITFLVSGFDVFKKSIGDSNASLITYVAHLITAGSASKATSVSNKELAVTNLAVAGTTDVASKSMIGLQAALGLIAIGIAVFSIAVNAVIKHKKELQEIIDNNIAKNKEELKSLEELTSKYKELSTQEKTIETKKELIEIEEQLIALYGDESKGLDLVNGNLETQLKLLDDFAKHNYSELFLDGVSSYNKSKNNIDFYEGDNSKFLKKEPLNKIKDKADGFYFISGDDYSYSENVHAVIDEFKKLNVETLSVNEQLELSKKLVDDLGKEKINITNPTAQKMFDKPYESLIQAYRKFEEDVRSSQSVVKEHISNGIKSVDFDLIKDLEQAVVNYENAANVGDFKIEAESSLEVKRLKEEIISLGDTIGISKAEMKGFADGFSIDGIKQQINELKDGIANDLNLDFDVSGIDNPLLKFSKNELEMLSGAIQTSTDDGLEILKNFIYEFNRSSGDLDVSTFLEEFKYFNSELELVTSDGIAFMFDKIKEGVDDADFSRLITEIEQVRDNFINGTTTIEQYIDNLGQKLDSIDYSTMFDGDTAKQQQMFSASVLEVISLLDNLNGQMSSSSISVSDYVSSISKIANMMNGLSSVLNSNQSAWSKTGSGINSAISSLNSASGSISKTIGELDSVSGGILSLQGLIQGTIKEGTAEFDKAVDDVSSSLWKMVDNSKESNLTINGNTYESAEELKKGLLDKQFSFEQASNTMGEMLKSKIASLMRAMGTHLKEFAEQMREFELDFTLSASLGSTKKFTMPDISSIFGSIQDAANGDFSSMKKTFQLAIPEIKFELKSGQKTAKTVNTIADYVSNIGSKLAGTTTNDVPFEFDFGIEPKGNYKEPHKEYEPNEKKSGNRKDAKSDDTHKKAFDELLKNLQYARDSDAISEEEYLNKLRLLNDEYFKDKVKYLDDYRKYEIEIYRGLKKVEETKLQNDLSVLQKKSEFLSGEENVDALKENYSNQINLYKKMQDNLHQEANKHRELGYAETSVEITTLQGQWLDYAKLIEDTFIKSSTVEYDINIEKIESKISQLKSTLDSTGEENFNARIRITNEMITEQSNIVDEHTTQLERLKELFNSNSINAEQFRISSQGLNTAIVDGTIALKGYKTELLNLELGELNNQAKAMNDLLEMTKSMIKSEHDEEMQAIKDKIKAIQLEKKERKSLQDAIKKSLDTEKDAYNEKKKALQDEFKIQKDLNSERKKAIDEELKAYKKIIDQKKTELDLIKEQNSYKNDLDEKKKNVGNIEDRLAELSGNDSRQAEAERKELLAELDKKRKELDTFLLNDSVDSQKDALDSEYERFKELKEKEKSMLDDEITEKENRNKHELDLLDKTFKIKEDAFNREMENLKELDIESDEFIERLNQDIEGVQDRIKNNGDLVRMAMERISNDGDKLYTDLIAWNDKYGSAFENDILKIQEAYTREIGSTNNAMGTMISILERTLDLESQILEVRRSAGVSSGNMGVRDYYTDRGYDVGWLDDTKQFTINGKAFDSGSFNNNNGRLDGSQSDFNQIDQWLDYLKSINKFDQGGYIKTDQIAVVHKNERILRDVETKDLHSILPSLMENSFDIMNNQRLLLNNLGSVGSVNPNESISNNLSNINITNSNNIVLDGSKDNNSIMHEFDVKLRHNNEELAKKFTNAVNSLAGGKPKHRTF